MLRKFREAVAKVLMCSNSATHNNDNTSAENPGTVANDQNTSSVEGSTPARNDNTVTNDDDVVVHPTSDAQLSINSPSPPFSNTETVPHARPVVNRIARVLLAGVYLPSSSPFRILRSCPEVLELIFVQVKKAWRNQLFYGDEHMYRGPSGKMESTPWEQTPRPPMELVSQMALHCSHDSGIEFPPPTDLYCNMLPFRPAHLSSVPPEYHGYLPLIRQCDSDFSDDSVWYLTIHESRVMNDAPQRRGGIHVEGFLAMPAICASPPWWYGWGHGLHGERYHGGIFHASTVSNSCKMWHVQIPRKLSDVLQIGCDLEHLRGTLNEFTQAIVPKKNELWWMTDATPHESLPLKPGTYRQYFRVVAGEVSAWWSKHSTPNRLGVLPDCQILDHDKLEEGAYMDFDDIEKSKCLLHDRLESTTETSTG